MGPDLIAHLLDLAYNIYYSHIVLFDQEEAMALDQTISISQNTFTRIGSPILIKKTIGQNKINSSAPVRRTGVFY